MMPSVSISHENPDASKPTQAEAAAFGITVHVAESASDAVCINCGHKESLVTAGDVVYCLACGYASDGLRGCT